jgi:hypothetical protein
MTSANGASGSGLTNGQHVDVVPLKGHGEGQDVELVDRGLRLKRQEWRLGIGQCGELLFRRQEHPLADDVVADVEEAVDRLKAEV